MKFARMYVRQSLPDEVTFLVYPNQSYDGHSRVGDEVIFPDESLPTGEHVGPLSTDEVVNLLWRNNKVPEWIDVAVRAVEETRTLIALRCCGRFTEQEELLYYRGPRRTPPFGIKSPDLPPDWKGLEESGKFDLHWWK
jgi:hypothetical protein